MFPIVKTHVEHLEEEVKKAKERNTIVFKPHFRIISAVGALLSVLVSLAQPYAIIVSCGFVGLLFLQMFLNFKLAVQLNEHEFFLITKKKKNPYASKEGVADVEDTD